MVCYPWCPQNLFSSVDRNFINCSFFLIMKSVQPLHIIERLSIKTDNSEIVRNKVDFLVCMESEGLFLVSDGKKKTFE